jgi:hypothetical protein
MDNTDSTKATNSGADTAKAAEPTPVSAADAVTKILQVQPDPSRGEVSASTIGRMLGLATVGELHMLESKVDLLTTKLNAFSVRIDRIVSMLSSAPTGKDLERIDVQIAAMRQMLREGLAALNVKTADDGQA